jgi:acyl-CoA thioesterase
MLDRDFCSQSAGIELQSVGPGRAVASMRVRENMVNGHDICHGGMVFVLADTTFAYACNSHNRNTVASSSHIDFINPALLGQLLTASAEEKHLRGRIGVYDVTVSSEDGKVIAFMRGKSHRVDGSVIPGTES